MAQQLIIPSSVRGERGGTRAGMWLTRDALVLSALSAQPRFDSMHNSRVRAGGKGVRLSRQHTLNTAVTLCSAQALHLPDPGRGLDSLHNPRPGRVLESLQE